MKCKSLFLIASVILSACGTTKSVDMARLNDPIPENKARVVIERDTSLLYLAATADVRLNGTKIASLGRGGSVMQDISTGNNYLTASTPASFGQFSSSFNAKAGETYFFTVSPRSEAMHTSALWGVLGEAIDASISDQSGYFQINLREIQK